MIKIEQKNKVASYWNKEACGTSIAIAKKYTVEYYDEIEEYRYRVEPEIFAFAQFTRYRNQKILEVGIGAGTDFIQWVRAGTKAYGVDLTQEAIEHAVNRLNLLGLSAEEVRVADAENLPYEDNFFDLVYSWGVIHHTPDTVKAFEEIIRCTKKGGAIKIMIYNRRSLCAFYKYLRFGLLAGKPFRSISEILYQHQESIGTKAFTMSEIRQILSNYPVEIEQISANVTSYDLLWDKPRVYRDLAYILACVFGYQKCGWYMTIGLKKKL